VIVDVHADLFPLGVFVRMSWQRFESEPVQSLVQLSA